MTREDLMQQLKRTNAVLASGKGPQKYVRLRKVEITTALADLKRVAR